MKMISGRDMDSRWGQEGSVGGDSDGVAVASSGSVPCL